MVTNVHKFIEVVDKELSKYGIFNQLESATKVPKPYLALGLFCALIFISATVLSAEFIVSLLGVVYPVYATHNAIESENKPHLTQILTYWIIFGTITVFESMPWDPMTWIPAYQLLKATFLIFLFVPKYSGSVVIYNKFLKGFLVKYSPVVGKFICCIKKFGEESCKSSTTSTQSAKTSKATD